MSSFECVNEHMQNSLGENKNRWKNENLSGIHMTNDYTRINVVEGDQFTVVI